MISISSALKLSLTVLIISTLACSRQAHKPYSIKDTNLTPRRAANINWNDRTVKFYDHSGNEIKGRLHGWTTTGFIVEHDKITDTLEYNDLRNYMMVQTGKKNNAKGAKYGLYSGLGLAALSSYLIIKGTADDDDDPLITLHDDSPSDEPFGYVIAGLTAPVVVATSAGIGALIGSFSDQYDKYYFNYNDFAKIPYDFEYPRKIYDNFNSEELN